MIYFAILIILMGLALIEIFTENNKIVFIVGTLLSVMAGLRYYTGYDFRSYQEYYYQADQLGDIFNGSIRLEGGYLFLSTLFSELGFNYYTFILFFSLLSLFLLTLFVYRYVPYPSMVLVYYYSRYFLVRDMGQVRASLAAIILLFAIPAIFNKKPWKFVIIIFLASLFHISAWIFLIMYPLSLILKKITITKSVGLLIFAGFAGLLVNFPALYIWAVPDGYTAYFTSPSYTNGPWIMNPILWMQIFLFFGALYFIKFEKGENQQKVELLIKIYLIASLALLAAGSLGTVGGRISTFFASVEIILVPILFMEFSKNKFLNLILFFGFTTAIFLLIFIISGTYLEYVPYKTIF